MSFIDCTFTSPIYASGLTEILKIYNSNIREEASILKINWKDFENLIKLYIRVSKIDLVGIEQLKNLKTASVAVQQGVSADSMISFRKSKATIKFYCDRDMDYLDFLSGFTPN